MGKQKIPSKRKAGNWTTSKVPTKKKKITKGGKQINDLVKRERKKLRDIQAEMDAYMSEKKKEATRKYLQKKEQRKKNIERNLRAQNEARKNKLSERDLKTQIEKAVEQQKGMRG